MLLGLGPSLIAMALKLDVSTQGYRKSSSGPPYCDTPAVKPPAALARPFGSVDVSGAPRSTGVSGLLFEHMQELTKWPLGQYAVTLHSQA